MASSCSLIAQCSGDLDKAELEEHLSKVLVLYAHTDEVSAVILTDVPLLMPFSATKSILLNSVGIGNLPAHTRAASVLAK
jgi:hypothetical protein